MVEEIPERLIHALHQGGEGLGGGGFAGVAVRLCETGIGLEGRMHRVVGEVKKKGLPLLHGGGDMGLGLAGERFGQEHLAAVVFFQAGHGVGGGAGARIVLRPVIAPRLPHGATPGIDREAQVEGVGPGAAARPQVAFAHVKGAVAGLLQEAWQGHRVRRQTLPIPIRRALGAPIVFVRIDPIGGAVPRRILPREQRQPRRRAHAHGTKLVEADAALRQALHVGGPIKIVERIALRPPFRIRQKGQRGVHHPHVIDQKDHNVRPDLRRRGGRQTSQEKEG